MSKKHIGSILLTSLHGYVAADPELGKPDTGGQVVYVLEMAKRFTRLGYRVDVVTRGFDKQKAMEKINPNCRLLRIPYGPSGFVRKEDMHDYLNEFVTNFLAFVRKRRIQYDFAYSHYWDAGFATQKVAEELRIPHVHTPHSLGWWKRHNMPGEPEALEKEYRFEERIHKEFLLYRLCDHVVATTQEQADIIQEQYDILPEHVSVIPPGMDENRFRPIPSAERAEIRKRYDIGDFDVLALGRMAANKGHDLLIRAMPTLINLVPKGRLLACIGGEANTTDEEQINKLKEEAQQVGVADKIKWVGYVGDDDLANYYRAAGVYALSSRYEPFGMTAIEAMACGTPTVITVHGGLLDLVEFGTHALYADPLRPEEFGAVMALPFLHPALADRLSAEGARFSRRMFGWTGIARRTLDIFEHYRNKYTLSEDEDIV